MRIWLPLAPLVLLLGVPAWAQAPAEAPGDTLAGPEALQGYRFEHPRLTLRLTPRTPQQVAAFYEARGFPPAMVDALKARCFITVGVRNKSDDILWLALDNWRFINAAGEEVQRYDRAYWRARWAELDAPMAAQSTFRWTLMPETHDFLPGEAEGGNVVLARSAAAMSLQAAFVAGKEQDGERIAVRIDDLRCAEDPNP